MTHKDFEQEAEEAISFASKHNKEIDLRVAEGPGLEQYQALLRKYKRFAEVCERFPQLTKHVLGEFSERAMWEVLHGEMDEKPHHRRVLEGFYAFVEEHEADLATIEEEERAAAVKKENPQ